MAYLVGSGGSVLIVPSGQSTVVAITATSGASITVYSDVSRSTSVAMPDTIASNTLYYVKDDDRYTISCKVAGIEAARRGSVVGAAQVYLSGDTHTTVGVDQDTVDRGTTGGDRTPKRQSFSSISAVTVASGTAGTLSWVTNADYPSDDILDLTDPTAPLARVGGVYAVTAGISTGVGTAGSAFYGQIDLDNDGEDFTTNVQVGFPDAHPLVLPPLTLVAYVPAGGVFHAGCSNYDALSQDVFLAATVVLLN